MAVPKRKTSKSRRDRRRQHHGITPAVPVTCVRCKSPKLSHRVCPTCGTYRDRAYEPAASAS